MSRPTILSHIFPFGTLIRDLKLLSISNFIGAFGDGLFIYLLPIYIRGLGATARDVGLLYSILTLSTALTIIPGGFVADRFDRKKIMILGWLIWVPLPLVFSFAKHWSQLILPMISYGVFLSGPSISAYVVTAAGKGKITSTFTTLSASWSLGYIFSPALGGYLSAIMGMRWVFFLVLLFYSLAAITLFFIGGQHPAGDLNFPKISLGSDRVQARRIVYLSMFFGTAIFFLASVRPLVVQFLQDIFALDAFHIGLLGSVTFLGQAAFLIALGKIGDRWTKMGAVAVSLLLSSASFAFLISFNNFVSLALASFLNGASFSMWALMNACIGAIAPEASRGRWISLSQTVSAMAAFAGPYLGGVLYEASTYMPFFVTIVVAPLLCLLALRID